MLEKPLSFQNSKPILWTLTVFLFIALVVGYLVVDSFPVEEEVVSMNLKEKEESSSFSPLIREGPLGLSPSSFCVEMPDLSPYLSFSAKWARPDGEETVLWKATLFSSGEMREGSLGEPFYLEDREGTLHFSDHPLFWVKVEKISEGKVEGRYGLENKIVSSFVIPLVDMPAETPLTSSPFFSLFQGKLLGVDLLVQEIYKKNLTQRVEIPSQETLEVEEGDFLVWENSWKKISSLQEAKGKDVARVKTLSSTGLLVEGWDPSGEHFFTHTFKGVETPNFSCKGKELFSEVRLRAPKEISCFLEKQKVIFQVGDCLVKKGGKWQKLSSKEKLLSFDAENIFLFQELEKKGKEFVMKGTFFNQARTAKQPVSLLFTQKRIEPNPTKGKK